MTAAWSPARDGERQRTMKLSLAPDDVSERLFRSGVQVQLAKRRWQVDELEKSRLREMNGCTFSPQISARAERLRRPRSLSPENRFPTEVERRRQKLLQKRRERALAELAGCTFQPLTLRAASLSPFARTRDGKIHEALHRVASLKKRWQDQVGPDALAMLEDQIHAPDGDFTRAAPQMPQEEIEKVVLRLLRPQARPHRRRRHRSSSSASSSQRRSHSGDSGRTLPPLPPSSALPGGTEDGASGGAHNQLDAADVPPGDEYLARLMQSDDARRFTFQPRVNPMSELFFEQRKEKFKEPDEVVERLLNAGARQAELQAHLEADPARHPHATVDFPNQQPPQPFHPKISAASRATAENARDERVRDIWLSVLDAHTLLEAAKLTDEEREAKRAARAAKHRQNKNDNDGAVDDLQQREGDAGEDDDEKAYDLTKALNIVDIAAALPFIFENNHDCQDIMSALFASGFQDFDAGLFVQSLLRFVAKNGPRPYVRRVCNSPLTVTEENVHRSLAARQAVEGATTAPPPPKQRRPHLLRAASASARPPHQPHQAFFGRKKAPLQPQPTPRTVQRLYDKDAEREEHLLEARILQQKAALGACSFAPATHENPFPPKKKNAEEEEHPKVDEEERGDEATPKRTASNLTRSDPVSAGKSLSSAQQQRGADGSPQRSSSSAGGSPRHHFGGGTTISASKKIVVAIPARSKHRDPTNVRANLSYQERQAQGGSGALRALGKDLMKQQMKTMKRNRMTSGEGQ